MVERRAPTILKLGGTSLAGTSRLRRAAAIVRRAARHSPVVVVVSAMGGVTDPLLALVAAAEAGERRWPTLLADIERRHRKAMRDLSHSREWPEGWAALRERLAALRDLVTTVGEERACAAPRRAMILAAGERLSAVLTAAALRATACRPQIVDATELIVTDSDFSAATVDHPATAAAVRRRLGAVSSDVVPVVTGFIGADREGRTTLLGRGGSDYTAALIGAALAARRVEIWTDVPGVLSAPPRWVPETVTVPRLSPAEATALARWGGEVLHPLTLAPLAASAIPVVVASSFDADAPATVVAGGAVNRRAVAISGLAGVAVTSGDGVGTAVLDGEDGSPRGTLVRAAGKGALAVVAVVGGGWSGELAAAVRALRLPVLGVVPELEPGAAGLVVREHYLRRTVKALHDTLIRGLALRAMPSLTAPLEAR